MSLTARNTERAKFMTLLALSQQQIKALESLVSRIEDADKAAQKLLFAKVGVIMREMNRVNRQEKARGAYRRDASSAAPRPLGFLPDTPMFVDARS